MSKKKPGDKYDPMEVALGLLPQSHIYALVVICHATTYRGDQVINIPKMDMGVVLGSIQRFKINTLFLVCLLDHEQRSKPNSNHTPNHTLARSVAIH